MNKRMTIQKKLVANTVGALKTHPPADEVYNRVIQSNPTVSRATVYRILGEMAQDGQILRIEIPNAPDRFDFNTARHYHFKCKRCGFVGDVYMPEEKACVAFPDGDFEIEDYDLMFKGLCGCCKNKEKSDG